MPFERIIGVLPVFFQYVEEDAVGCVILSRMRGSKGSPLLVVWIGG